jgi:hypothetical protein
MRELRVLEGAVACAGDFAALEAAGSSVWEVVVDD